MVWGKRVPEAEAAAFHRLLGPLNMAGKGDGKGGDGGEGTLITLVLALLSTLVGCAFCYICKNACKDCTAGGLSAGERKGRRILARHKAKRIVPVQIKVRAKRNYEDEMENYVKKKQKDSSTLVDRMYDMDRQFGSGKREKDKFKPPKLVNTIYGDVSHSTDQTIAYKI